MISFPDGASVPALGQGTWMMAERPDRRSQEIAALREGVELGMTLIDTAEMYGEGAAEELVAEAVAGLRDRVFLVSKAYPQNASRARLPRACEASLKRLAVERLDLYLLHWRGNVLLAETVEAMQRLVEAGKIARWGVSNLDTDDMEELLEAGGEGCATNQILYNLSRRGPDGRRLMAAFHPSPAYRVVRSSGEVAPTADSRIAPGTRRSGRRSNGDERPRAEPCASILLRISSGLRTLSLQRHGPNLSAPVASEGPLAQGRGRPMKSLFIRAILTIYFIRINKSRTRSAVRGVLNEPTMTHVETNGIELACETFGLPSDESILLIVGLGTQMVRWTVPFCLDLVARGYHVIRFDNRDAGRSTHISNRAPPDFGELAAALKAGRMPEVPYTLRDMAADAVGLLDALSIDRAHVVGRSMGGMIAQVMACEHRERVASLTSIMSSTGNPALPPPLPDAMAMMTSPAPDPVSDEAGYLAHSLAFARRIAGRRYPFDEAATRRLIIEEARRAQDRNGFARQIAAIAVAGDRRARLRTVVAPTLVIHGSDDPLFPPACGEDTAASIPDAEFMLLEGMGHDLPPDLYGAVAEAIDRVAKRPRWSA